MASENTTSEQIIEMQEKDILNEKQLKSIEVIFNDKKVGFYVNEKEGKLSIGDKVIQLDDLTSFHVFTSSQEEESYKISLKNGDAIEFSLCNSTEKSDIQKFIKILNKYGEAKSSDVASTDSSSTESASKENPTQPELPIGSSVMFFDQAKANQEEGVTNEQTIVDDQEQEHEQKQAVNL